MCPPAGLLYKASMVHDRTIGTLDRLKLPLWLRAAIFSLSYFLCALIGSALSANAGTYVSFWLPAGLFAAGLLLAPKREWFWLCLAVLPANFAFDLIHDVNPNPTVITLFYAANVLPTVVGAWLVRRFVAETVTLATLNEFFGVLFFCGILSPMIGAFIGVKTLVTFGLSDTFFKSWLIWWLGCVMAVVVFLPLLLAWLARPNWSVWLSRFSDAKRIEATLLFGGMFITAWHQLVVAEGINGRIVPLLIFVLWAGLRFGLRGGSLAVFSLSLWMAWLTTKYLKGLSPEEISSAEYMLTLQVFMAVAAAVALVPAVVMDERNRSFQRLRESEEKFSKAFRTSPSLMSITDLETGRYLEINDAYEKILGFNRAELIGRSPVELGLVVDLALREQKLAQLKATGSISNWELQIRNRAGELLTFMHSAEVMALGGRPCVLRVSHDITEQRAAAQATRESEEKFSKAFRSSPDAMAISDLVTGQFMEVNDGFPRIYGYTREEMVGRSSIALGMWRDAEDRAEMSRRLKNDGAIQNLESMGRKRNGELFPNLFSGEIIELKGRQCLISVVRDLTAQRQAEQALRESEKSLRATIENTPNVAVQWFNRQARVVYWNYASETMYGWTAAEAMGKTLDEMIFTPEQAADFAQVLKEIEHTGKPFGPAEFPFRRRDEKMGVLRCTVFQIQIPSGEPGFVCMDVDLTEQKNAEQAREQAVTREQQSRIEYTLRLLAAQEAERKRIATELHDSLGQNLLLIKNRAQMALKPAGQSAEVRAQLEVINQLATACIAEARQISHDLHPHQLEHLGLKRSLELLLANTAEASEIKFTWKIDETEKIFHGTAEMNFYRILQESLNNILKHSQAKNVEVSLERDIHEVQLRITDDGCGFDVATMTQNKKGMGLQNIIERVRMLGGKAGMDTAPGRGTRVMVTVPIPAEPE